MAVERFADFSSFQPDYDIDWPTYGKSTDIAAMRSDEGKGFTDPAFAVHRTNARTYVRRLVIYHFGRPDLGNDPVAEANAQYAVTGPLRPLDRVALDIEVGGSPLIAEWCYQFLIQQQKNYSKVPAIYASDAYIRAYLQDVRLKAFPLWLAKWQFTPNERPPCPPPWDTYEYLQYSDQAIDIPGVSVPVDADVFFGEDLTMPAIDLTMPEIANYFAQASGNAWARKDNGLIIGNAMLDAYRNYGDNRLKGLYHLGLPVSNEYPADHAPNTQQDFELGRLVYDTDGSMGGRPGQATGVYPLHVLPQQASNQPAIDQAAQDLQAIQQSAQAALTALGK